MSDENKRPFMERATKWAIKVKLWHSVIRIFIGIIMGISISIPWMGKIFTDIVREEIRPVVGYQYDDLTRMAEKLIKLTIKNPNKVELSDVKHVIDSWPRFREFDLNKLEFYENIMNRLNDWYIDSIGG